MSSRLARIIPHEKTAEIIAEHGKFAEMVQLVHIMQDYELEKLRDN